MVNSRRYLGNIQPLTGPKWKGEGEFPKAIDQPSFVRFRPEIISMSWSLWPAYKEINFPISCDAVQASYWYV